MPARYFYRTEARRTRTRRREQTAWLWDSDNASPRAQAVANPSTMGEERNLLAERLDAARQCDRRWRWERTRAMQGWIDAAWSWENTGHRRIRLGALGMLSGLGGSSVALVLPLFTAGSWLEYLAIAGYLLLLAGVALFALGWLTETTAASARRWLLATARRSDAPVRDPSRGE